MSKDKDSLHARMEQGIRNVEKKIQDAVSAVERKVDGEPACYRCGEAAHVNDGDDHLGPPVCTRCFLASPLSVREALQALLDSQPPPVSGDYGSDAEEDAAIEARDFIRDWYRRELRQILKGGGDE